MSKKKDKLILKSKDLKIVRNINLDDNATEILDECIHIMLYIWFTKESIRKALDEATV